MKPAPFLYLAPKNVPDTLVLLARHGAGAKILAGGQSLIPVLNFRLGRYDCLIDINKVSDLAYITVAGNLLRIGAMTRYRTIERSDVVKRHAPLLAEATRFVAHLPIRTRGTIGGSLAHADPSAEYPAIMLALDAHMVVRSERGLRQIPAREFLVAPMETALEPDELLEEIRIPLAAAGQSFAFEEVSRRRGDFALVGVAAVVQIEAGRLKFVRIAACGLENGSQRIEEAEQRLSGAEISDAVIQEAARVASESVVAQDDLHATARYRIHLVELLTKRVLKRALERARPTS